VLFYLLDLSLEKNPVLVNESLSPGKRVVSTDLLHLTHPNKVRLPDIWTVFQAACKLIPVVNIPVKFHLCNFHYPETKQNLCSSKSCVVTVLGREGIVRRTAVGISNTTQASAQ
jgi:hypothetical protein